MGNTNFTESKPLPFEHLFVFETKILVDKIYDKTKMKTLQHIATPGDFLRVKQHCPAYRACFTLTAVYTSFPFGFENSLWFQIVLGPIIFIV